MKNEVYDGGIREALFKARSDAGLSTNTNSLNRTVQGFLEVAELMSSGELGIDQIKSEFARRADDGLGRIDEAETMAKDAAKCAEESKNKFLSSVNELYRELDRVSTRARVIEEIVSNFTNSLTDPVAMESVNILGILMYNMSRFNVTSDESARVARDVVVAYLSNHGVPTGSPVADIETSKADYEKPEFCWSSDADVNG